MALALIFDLPSGVAGDMLVASLLELTPGGEAYLKRELEKLRGGQNHLPPLSFATKVINKQGIEAREIAFDVPQTADWSLNTKGPQSPPPSTSPPAHRHLKDIYRLLEHSALPLPVVEKAKHIFDILATAEGAVHGLPKEKVHFHEVGSLDALCDVVSAVSLLNQLGVKQVYASPVTVGRGTVSCSHGTMPVPVPAVVKMLETYSIPTRRASGESGELSTPTGVAILCGLGCAFEMPQPYLSLKSAFGAGQKDLPGQANVLRARLVDCPLAATAAEGLPKDVLQGFKREQVWQVETNIDDMSGEALGYITEDILKQGALEVWLEPLLMKKGRPAHKVAALVEEKNKDKVLAKILRETSSLGVRTFLVERVIFKRRENTVQVEGHKVRVKMALLEDQVYKWKAEARDVIALCRQKAIPWSEAKTLIAAQVANKLKDKNSL